MLPLALVLILAAAFPPCGLERFGQGLEGHTRFDVVGQLTWNDRLRCMASKRIEHLP